jgi:hypothetical protein
MRRPRKVENLTPAQRMAKSVQKLKEEGGGRLSVLLRREANEALNMLLDAGAYRTIRDLVEGLLIRERDRIFNGTFVIPLGKDMEEVYAQWIEDQKVKELMNAPKAVAPKFPNEQQGAPQLVIPAQNFVESFEKKKAELLEIMEAPPSSDESERVRLRMKKHRLIQDIKKLSETLGDDIPIR